MNVSLCTIKSVSTGKPDIKAPRFSSSESPLSFHPGFTQAMDAYRKETGINVFNIMNSCYTFSKGANEVFLNLNKDLPGKILAHLKKQQGDVLEGYIPPIIEGDTVITDFSHPGCFGGIKHSIRKQGSQSRNIYKGFLSTYDTGSRNMLTFTEANGRCGISRVGTIIDKGYVEMTPFRKNDMTFHYKHIARFYDSEINKKTNRKKGPLWFFPERPPKKGLPAYSKVMLRIKPKEDTAGCRINWKFPDRGDTSPATARVSKILLSDQPNEYKKSLLYKGPLYE